MLTYALEGGKRLRPMIAYEISKFILLKRQRNINTNLASISEKSKKLANVKDIKNEENILQSIILFVE